VLTWRDRITEARARGGFTHEDHRWARGWGSPLWFAEEAGGLVFESVPVSLHAGILTPSAAPSPRRPPGDHRWAATPRRPRIAAPSAGPSGAIQRRAAARPSISGPPPGRSPRECVRPDRSGIGSFSLR
jgi:hypothetical protein